MEAAGNGVQMFLETRGFRVPVDDFPFRLGHASTCDFQIEDDPAVSPHHAEIARDGEGGFVLRDTASDTGVRLNDRLLAGHHRLRHGDVFTIGGAEFRVEFERLARESQPAAAPAAAEGVPVAAGPPTGGPSPGKPPPPGGRSLTPWMFVAGVAVLILGAIVLASIGNDGPKTVSELVREAKPSTMLVKGFDGDDPVGSGSAWVYDSEEGQVVTNSHVLTGADRFEVSLEGESSTREAEVFAVAECDDVAMLATRETEGLRTFPLAAESDPPEQGEDVIVLGYPSNASTADELQVTTGSLSALNINWDEPARDSIDFAVYPDVHQVDAAINPGNSGGPLFDGQGDLIGMNSTRAEGDNQGFAISIDRLRALLPLLAEGESRGWAGFTFTALSAAVLNRLASRFNLVGGWNDSALLIDSIIPGTAAARAGLQVGDAIYAIDGRSVNSRSAYCRAVGGKSEEPVDISYWTARSDWAEDRTVSVRFE